MKRRRFTFPNIISRAALLLHMHDALITFQVSSNVVNNKFSFVSPPVSEKCIITCCNIIVSLASVVTLVSLARYQHLAKEAMNLRGILTSSINYRYMIGFRANNRQRVIGTFCNLHVNSKQRETNEVRV